MIFSAFERMVAFRYLRARRKEGFVSVIAAFSFLGIVLGVATLIIVMAVMNGFRQELLSRVLGLNGHLGVYAVHGTVLNDYETLAGQAAAFLDARRNPDFNPHRRAISKTDDPEIVCQCENVTCGEILEAIRRGAASVDAVKRRVGSGMGRCQGSRCSFAIEKLLEEAHGGTC